MQALAPRKRHRDVRAGFNGIQHESRLHAEALASLGATSRQHSTAALGGHAGTEAVNLSTLAGVRLVRAFHWLILSYVSEQLLDCIASGFGVKDPKPLHHRFCTSTARMPTGKTTLEKFSTSRIVEKVDNWEIIQSRWWKSLHEENVKRFFTRP